MSYIDVYFSRVNHYGEDVNEIAKNVGARSFERWLNESPNTVKKLSVERGLFFSGVILTNKDKEQSKIMYLNVANDVPLLVGDVLNWGKEKWILFSKEKKVRETHQTFSIIRCNYLIKWIDDNGHLKQSWSYLVSSMDSKIKENFRTWNSLITPQPNKYLEALLPTTPLNRLTRFVIEEEGWYVVEYDHTSVPGVMYVSMTEEKVNSLTDDIENEIADLDKLAKYSIVVPAESQCFKVGEEIAPIFTVMKNGSPLYMATEITPLDKNMVRREGEKIYGVREGQTKVRIRLKDFPEVFVDEDIKIGLDEEFAAYIAGKASIRLNRTEVYELYSNQEIIGDVSYSISDEVLAAIAGVENNKCYIKANGKNKLGTLILYASYGGKTYEKEIKIAPLW